MRLLKLAVASMAIDWRESHGMGSSVAARPGKMPLAAEDRACHHMLLYKAAKLKSGSKLRNTLESAQLTTTTRLVGGLGACEDEDPP
jgi:hypothetical protein